MGVTRVVHLFLNSIGDRPEPGVTTRFVQNRTLRVRRNRKRTISVQCYDHRSQQVPV
jgi:hypothetical protein